MEYFLHTAKHYYAGSERIASRLAGPSTAFVDAEDLEGDHVDALPALQQMDIRIPVQGWGIGLGQGSFENVPLPGDECDNYTPESEEYKQCICEQDGNCPDVIYWYHPDHLGSSTFLTDRAGQPYQFVMYLPFGETFAEQRAAGFGTPYLFNAKELDEETGLYYYGARYYDPRISTWWGVDPKAADAPNWTPYRYAFNNPIRIIDPDGQFETKFGAWLYNASQGFKGKVHKSQTRPGEYYVGRQIQSSNEARYDIKWSGNSERPGGGLINAVDKIPKLAGVFGSRASEDVLIPHGEDIGKGMQLTGDLIELGGWATAIETAGAGMLAVGVGKLLSGSGMALENWSRFKKEGPTSDNIINGSIDLGIELLPVPFDHAIQKSGLKTSIKTQLRGILSSETKLLKEQIKSNLSDKP